MRTLWPSVETVHEFLAASYARTGRIDLARRETAALTEAYPDNNLALYRLHYSSYYKDEQDLGDHLDALKLAGVAAWPFGLDPKSANRIVGSELKALVSGQIWSGRIWAGPTGPGVEFVRPVQFRQSYRLPHVRHLHDRQCSLRRQITLRPLRELQRDHWVCGEVYRNTTNPERGGDYLYLAPTIPRYFSLKR